MQELFNSMNKFRYAAAKSGPKPLPTLFEQSAKAFVNGLLHRVGWTNLRITELHFLPAVALSSIFEEMVSHSSLRKILHNELSDPVLFMRVFSHPCADRLVLENCLRVANLEGKPVLPEMARNWCKIDPENTTSSRINRIGQGLKLGTYLHDAGWAYQSAQVLDAALNLIPLVEESQHCKTLEVECLRAALRAEGSAMLNLKAEATCERLLDTMDSITDDKVLFKVYVEVASNHFKARRVDDGHRWSAKAMDLMNDSTPVESVIELLQLEAQYLYQCQRHDEANLIISQAIHRARTTYGPLHRRYADTLFTYGVCLLEVNAISDGIPVMMELLDIVIKLYGKLTPHVAIIQGHLAYAFYRRSQTTGRFDMAFDQIQKAIVLWGQTMPERKPIIERFYQLRTTIMRGRDHAVAAIADNRAPRWSDYPIISVAEIKQRCLQLVT